jgi:hypothetical protein
MCCKDGFWMRKKRYITIYNSYMIHTFAFRLVPLMNRYFYLKVTPMLAKVEPQPSSPKMATLSNQ